MRMYLVKLIMCVAILFPVAGYTAPLTDADVEYYIKTYPLVSDVLEKIYTKIGDNDDMSMDLAGEQIKGRMYRKTIEMIVGWAERKQLENIVIKQGFKNLADWALLADRIVSVNMSLKWVVGLASMTGDKSLNKNTNLFTYLDNNKIDMTLRKKYRQHLNEMCDRMCYEKSDLEMFRKNYAKISKVLNKN